MAEYDTFGLRSGYVIGLEASGDDKYYVLFGVLETPSGLSPHAAWSVRWLVFTSAFGGWLRDLVVALNRLALRCEPSVGGLSRGKPQAKGTVERVRRKS
jgi:hypothetical protein